MAKRGSMVSVKVESFAPDGSRRPFAQWVDDMTAMLPKKVIYPAAADAMNRTADRAKTRGVRRVAQATMVKQKLVRDRTYVAKAAGKPGRLTVTLKWYGRGLSLPALNAKRKGTGVKAGKHFFDKGFLNVSSKNQEMHGFRRLEEKTWVGTGSSRKRTKLEVLKVHFKGTEHYKRAFDRYAKTFLPMRFMQQVEYRLAKEKLTKGGRR